jgi:hypothetical protein
MAKKMYEWKMPGLAKGLDATEAMRELKRIEKTYGALTPEIIVEAAKPSKSVLHCIFEWDDQRAAEQHRLNQARKLLNNIDVQIISDGQPRQVPVFELVRKNEENVYKNISDLTEEEIQQVKKNAIRELNFWKSKLGFYKDFQSAAEKIGSAINELQEEKS